MVCNTIFMSNFGASSDFVFCFYGKKFQELLYLKRKKLLLEFMKASKFDLAIYTTVYIKKNKD